jgi:hypothetical protein
VKWALTLVVVLLSVIAPAAASANSWTSTADMPYYQWGGAAGITTVGDHILLAGGFGFDRNRVYAGLRTGFLGGNNAGQISWERGLGLPGRARGGLALAKAPDGRIYMMGGQTLKHVLNATVYRTSGTSWVRRASMPSPRTDLAAVATPDGRIFAIGGAVYAAGRYSPTVTVQIYDIATDTWSSGPPLPSPRSELGATLGADGRIYAFGGFDSGARREAFSLDPNDLAGGWSELPPMPSPHELTSAVTGPDGTMYVIGGWDGLRDLRRVDTYNPTVEGWRCAVPMSQGRSWAPAIASTWGMAAFGGANGSTLLGSHEFLRWSSIPVDHEPPVTTTPPTGHVPPGQVPLTNVPFVVSWADSDALTDIRDQTMLVTTDAGASYTPVAMPWPTIKSLRFTQYPGFPRLRFQMTPRDCPGNIGPAADGPGFSTHAAPETGARYAGGWQTGNSATARGGHTRYSSNPRATATFSFTGREIALFAPKSAGRGAARISVDGHYVTTITEYAKITTPRVVVFRHSFVRTGEHRITIRPVGTPGRPRVDIDGFLFIGAPAPLPATSAQARIPASGLHADVPRSGRRPAPGR